MRTLHPQGVQQGAGDSMHGSHQEEDQGGGLLLLLPGLLA